MNIRQATDHDRASICGVHRSSARSLSGVYTHDQIERWVSIMTPDRYTPHVDNILVAEEHGSIVGFVWLSDDGYVNAIYVAPAAAGKGVGSALLKRAEEKVIVQGITSLRLDATLNAVPFYERHGFVAEGDSIFRPVAEVEMRSTRMSKKL